MVTAQLSSSSGQIFFPLPSLIFRNHRISGLIKQIDIPVPSLHFSAKETWESCLPQIPVSARAKDREKSRVPALERGLLWSGLPSRLPPEDSSSALSPTHVGQRALWGWDCWQDEGQGPEGRSGGGAGCVDVCTGGGRAAVG